MQESQCIHVFSIKKEFQTLENALSSLQVYPKTRFRWASADEKIVFGENKQGWFWDAFIGHTYLKEFAQAHNFQTNGFQTLQDAQNYVSLCFEGKNVKTQPLHSFVVGRYTWPKSKIFISRMSPKNTSSKWIVRSRIPNAVVKDFYNKKFPSRKAAVQALMQAEDICIVDDSTI